MTRSAGALKLIIIVLLLLKSLHSWGADFQTLAGESPDNATLVFGGSFSPPTLEHMGLIARLVARFGFKETRMMVTPPYKEGAAPAQVSLSLTQIAVRHFYEVLDTFGIRYRNFEELSENRSRWTIKGKTLELVADNYEIQNLSQPDTLSTLKHLREASGSAKKTFWLSGGDSFALIKTWSPTNWQELFEHTHWLVVSRPGFDQRPDQINFERKDPLKGMFEPWFLERYSYFFDSTHQIHVYKNKDPNKPNIYIVDQPSLDDSSSKNRASLAEEGSHEHAQAGLQPSVFKECLDKGYYLTQNPSGSYRTYTQENLEIYLRSLFKRFERTGNFGSDVGSEQVQILIDALVEIAKEHVAANQEKPWVIKLTSKVYEGIVDHFREIKDFRNLRRKINEVSREYDLGKFAALYVALEIVETTLFPAFMGWIGGPVAFMLAPFMHPNEIITIPLYLGYRYWKKSRERMRLAGDLNLYSRFISYRNRLLRGDPDSIVARIKLSQNLGLGPDFVLNIVKSRLPKWVPLFIRQWDDRKIKWHDLNLSTNELRAILANDRLADVLIESAGKDWGLRSHLLIGALSDPEARLRLQLFVGHRYYSRLLAGNIPHEILAGFDERERAEMSRFTSSAMGIAQSLEADYRSDFLDLVSYDSAVTRLTSIDPALKDHEPFWTELRHQIATKYPGQTGKGKNLQNAHLVMAIIRGHQVSSADPSENIRITNLKNALKNFSAIAHTQLTRPGGASSSIFGEPLSTGMGGQEGNLVWEMRLLLSRVQQEKNLLNEAFIRGEQYLLERQHHRQASGLMWRALNQVLDQIVLIEKKLEHIEFSWLNAKIVHQGSHIQEPQIDGYEKVRDEIQQIAQEFEASLESLDLLNQVQLGSRPADITSPVALHKEINGILREKLGSPLRIGLFSSFCLRTFGI